MIQNSKSTYVIEAEDDIQRFRDMLLIDKRDVENELCKSAQILYEISERAAIASSIRDEEKDNLKTTEADLSIELRDQAESSKEKMTEAKLAQRVTSSKVRVNAHKRYVDACYVADMWNAMREAWISRGFAMRMVGQFELSGFFDRDEVRDPQYESNKRAVKRARLKE